MNRKDRRKIERKMKKLLKHGVALSDFGKQNVVYESDTYSPSIMKVASEVRQELARENPDAYLKLLKLVA